jgi:uncharacterized protein YbjT (DUF2867 family)
VRIFVAGATGVLGQRLVPLLLSEGHVVAAMTRTPSKLESIVSTGAEPVLCDVYDVASLNVAITDFGPEVVIHQLTDLPDDASRIGEFGARNSRIREEGTRNLLSAARAAGASRFIAQSVAWKLSGSGALAKTYLETAVLGAGGVVLRYGQFYGPGTFFESELPEHPRIHIDQAAQQTLIALDAPSSVIEVVET